MHTGDGFILVYSITHDQSLEELKSIREQIIRVHPKKSKVPMIVVGNMSDLADTKRAVSKREGESLADEFGASFMEVSAKANKNVKSAFQTLVKDIVTLNPSAGLSNGSGSVYGAGTIDNSGDTPEKDKKTKKKKSSKKETPVEDKSKKSGNCNIL